MIIVTCLQSEIPNLDLCSGGETIFMRRIMTTNSILMIYKLLSVASAVRSQDHNILLPFLEFIIGWYQESIKYHRSKIRVQN